MGEQCPPDELQEILRTPLAGACTPHLRVLRVDMSELLGEYPLNEGPISEIRSFVALTALGEREFDTTFVFGQDPTASPDLRRSAWSNRYTAPSGPSG